MPARIALFLQLTYGPAAKLGSAGKLAAGSLTQLQQRVPSMGYELSGEATDIQLGFMRLVQGITQGLLNVRQAKLMLAALQSAAASRWDNTATGDYAVTSNELPFTNVGSVVGRGHICQNMP
jgi:hypothetical protein